MTSAVDAAQRLIAVLEDESAALDRGDMAAAGALLALKLAAVESLAELPDTPAGAAIAQQVRTLAEVNRRALERAIAVQGRVVELVARATQRAAREAGRYGATGALAQDSRAMAVVTSA